MFLVYSIGELLLSMSNSIGELLLSRMHKETWYHRCHFDKPRALISLLILAPLWLNEVNIQNIVPMFLRKALRIT